MSRKEPKNIFEKLMANSMDYMSPEDESQTPFTDMLGITHGDDKLQKVEKEKPQQVVYVVSPEVFEKMQKDKTYNPMKDVTSKEEPGNKDFVFKKLLPRSD